MSSKTYWTVPLNDLMQQLETDLEQDIKKIVFKLFRSVVVRSPVLTGRFRTNWNISYGAPDNSVAATVNYSSRNQQELDKLFKLPLDRTLYLTNNLPYAERLEYGYSAKAPRGMVRVSIAEFSSIVKDSGK